VARVYSAALLKSGSGAYVDYHVPANTITVVRWVTGFNAYAITSELLHLLIGPLGITLVQYEIGPQASWTQEYRVVLVEGESLYTSNDGSIDCTVSGYELALP